MEAPAVVTSHGSLNSVGLGPSASCPAWYASTAELPRTGDTLTIVVVVPVGEMGHYELAGYLPSGSETRGAAVQGVLKGYSGGLAVHSGGALRKSPYDAAAP